MDKGELIILVFTGVVAFVGGLGVILAFIHKYFTQPQVESNVLQAQTNARLEDLAQTLSHQNEISEIKLLQVEREISIVDTKRQEGYVHLDGRLVSVESIVFKKD